MINDERWSVVIGCAGAGKTSYAMDLLEQALRNGLQWHQIGFSSFSRAACQEAVRRAAKLCGESEERLTSHGWFRTIHAAALRAVGGAGRIIDPDSKSGREFYADIKLPRGGDRGTLGESVAQVLERWDLARQMLWPLVDRPRFTGLPDGSPGSPGSPDSHPIPRGGATISTCENTGFSERFPPPFMYIGDFFSAISPRRSRNWVHPATDCDKSLYSNRLHAPTPPCAGWEWWERVGAGNIDGRSLHWCSGVANTNWADEIAQKFEDAKRLHNRLDFTDVLMRYCGLAVDTNNRLTLTTPEGTDPDECSLWFLDEAQDCSPLLWMTADRLTTNAAEVVALGDPYQAVYGFLGAAPEFLIGLADGSRQRAAETVLRRSWRNPQCVIDWAEAILMEDPEYVTRQPFSEHDDGSVGIVEWGNWIRKIDTLPEVDTMILGRTWFSLADVIKSLDSHGIPWASCGEKMASKWDAPVQLANVLTLRELQAGLPISEVDYRRLTEHYPQKHPEHGEFFTRGAKAKWKKTACSAEPQTTLDNLGSWDATPAFIHYIQTGLWKADKFAIIDYAITRWGIDAVRHPRIKLGTCHSVKGLEADIVYCVATSTGKAENADPAEERNLKYVAITRARHDYRLVYRNSDLAQSRPQFWCAPEKKSLTQEHIDTDQQFLEARRKKAEVRETDPIPDHSLPGEDGYLVCEGPSDWIESERDPGPDLLPQRETDRDGGQKAGRDSDTTPEIRTGEDQEEWWSL